MNPDSQIPATRGKSDDRQAIVIGASAGAIDALSQILPRLPRNFRLPILIVVHMPPDKDSVLSEIFAQKCALPVKEAEDKEKIADGAIYFAPPNYHLQVEPTYEISLSSDEPVLFSRPSINVLFETAREAYGAGLTGVILTGASADGADGLRTICSAGGRAFVQLPQTAEVPTMPQAAAAACPGARLLSLAQIAEELCNLPN